MSEEKIVFQCNHIGVAGITDAPEPEPVARVTGYYGGYLSIATVDGRVLPTGTALYAAPPASSVPDAWMVKNGFVCSMIYRSKKDADNYAADQQKRHDLSGSLASFCVIPLYTAPTPAEPPADVARDAERYRWLLENARATAEHWGGRWSLVIDSPAPGKDAPPEAINAAIDAAIEREILGGGNG